MTEEQSRGEREVERNVEREHGGEGKAEPSQEGPRVELPEVELRLPSVLEMAVGRSRLRVRGRTVPEALRSAFEQAPQLERHLLLESGDVRPHVLCVVNGSCLLREEVAGFTLRDGDEILIHQAISGG